MTLRDDGTLDTEQWARVRREAARSLREADAIGRYPTPVADIMDAARVKLDRDNVLDEGFLGRMRRKAGDALKSALSKVLGLFDARDRWVCIDRTVHLVKQTFLKLHETGHAVLPWQRDAYALVEDCERTLDPEVADLFDREANVFASEVLFQLDSFAEEARAHDFAITVPLRLGRKYGASAYSSIRQYVLKSDRACVVLVLDRAEVMESGSCRVTLRRVVASSSFARNFGALNWPDRLGPADAVGAMVPRNGRRMSRPRSLFLVDQRGERHECIGEAFAHPFNTFVLIHAVRTLTATSIVMPGVVTR